MTSHLVVLSGGMLSYLDYRSILLMLAGYLYHVLLARLLWRTTRYHTLLVAIILTAVMGWHALLFSTLLGSLQNGVLLMVVVSPLVLYAISVLWKFYYGVPPGQSFLRIDRRARCMRGNPPSERPNAENESQARQH